MDTEKNKNSEYNNTSKINNKGFEDEEIQNEKIIQIDDSEYQEPEVFVTDKKDYIIIWKAFYDNERHDFLSMMGYKCSDIYNVGIRKFIDANGWEKPEDVGLYKTDRFHITICSDCKKEFCAYEENHGLCDSCAKNYDIRFFDTMIAKMTNWNQLANAAEMATMFEAFKEYRELYKRENILTRIFTGLRVKNYTMEVKEFLQKELMELLKVNKNATKEDFIKRIIAKFSSSPIRYDKNHTLDIGFIEDGIKIIETNLIAFCASFTKQKEWAERFIKKLNRK